MYQLQSAIDIRRRRSTVASAAAAGAGCASGYGKFIATGLVATAYSVQIEFSEVIIAKFGGAGRNRRRHMPPTRTVSYAPPRVTLRKRL